VPGVRADDGGVRGAARRVRQAATLHRLGPASGAAVLVAGLATVADVVRRS